MNHIFTIGHSTYSIEDFVNKLLDSKIDLLVDVRSIPYSKRATNFNREVLQQTLTKNSIDYLYRGKNLGGLYENVGFESAIEELVELSTKHNIVLMCSEGDYQKCHRYKALTPEFEKRGKTVTHLAI